MTLISCPWCGTPHRRWGLYDPWCSGECERAAIIAEAGRQGVDMVAFPPDDERRKLGRSRRSDGAG